MRIAITGATGFVGRALAFALLAEGHSLQLIGRREIILSGSDLRTVLGPDLESDLPWNDVVSGSDIVIHCAGDAGSVKSRACPGKLHLRNAVGTERLAVACAQEGVGRLILLSSIKAMGERTDGYRPFTIEDTPNPTSPYGRSKFAAEQRLIAVSQQTGLPWTILRPAAIYGPGSQGNINKLIKLVRQRIPVPVGADNTRRSVLYIGNLCKLISCIIEEKGTENETLLVADDFPVPISEILEWISIGVGVTPNSISLPTSIVKLAQKFFGGSSLVEKFLSPLEIDVSLTKQRIKWCGWATTKDGIIATVKSQL